MDRSDDLSRLAAWPAYGWTRADKEQQLLPVLNGLTAWHLEHCPEYARIVSRLFPAGPARSFAELPYLPVRLFKQRQLASVPMSDVVTTMTSSGTSGQRRSQIYLDRITSGLQVKALSRIVADRVGPRRLPLLIIDARATVADSSRFSARTSGVRGFSMFGRDVEFALDDDMTLNLERTRSFVERHRGEPMLLFGFTFIVWRHLVEAMASRPGELDLSRGILIHGGGWKKLQASSVSDVAFKDTLRRLFGIADCCNYYGMVEQTGSIFMECEQGRLHASNWSEVVVRDPLSFAPLPHGRGGLLQVISALPHSYPGHSLLTEDLGSTLGTDDCPCGRMGTTFAVHGRLQQAEARGCSDTYSA